MAEVVIGLRRIEAWLDVLQENLGNKKELVGLVQEQQQVLCGGVVGNISQVLPKRILQKK
jgi:hypothetical protein